MITVEYDALYGDVVPDGRVAEYVDVAIQIAKAKAEYLVIAGCESLIYEFRLRILRGEISQEQIVFKFKDKIIPVNDCANLKEWPKGFSDYIDRALGEILMAQCKKAKERK